MMTLKEAERLSIMKQVERKELKQRQASESLNLSLRQTQRLIKSYKEIGPQGLISKRRGKPNKRKLPLERKEAIVTIVREKYPDFAPTFASEKLREEGISISREGLRKLMIEEGIWEAKKRKEKKVHQRRTRRSQEGELVQSDGSYHDWFEERAPKCCLIQFVDDATSKILYAKFCEWESTNNYFSCLEAYLKKYGKPQTFYVDKHSVFRVTREEIKKGEGVTTFHKALRSLKIELICANSPQAKGRVERKNGVLQDRLIKEMRLRKISSIEEGNRYLEEKFIESHNKQFGKAPASSQNGHKPLSPEEDLEKILATRGVRTISKNLTVQYRNQTYQLKTNTPNRMRYKKVTTIERAGKALIIEYQGKEVPYTLWQEHKYLGPEVIDDKQLESRWARKSA
jgi:transposase